jgi:cohesin loading factor subunit SCC2
MWFQPTKRGEDSRLLTRVTNITDVVAACKDTGYEWFEQLLDNVSWALLSFINSNKSLSLWL